MSNHWSKEKLTKTVKSNVSISGVLKEFGLSQYNGGNYRQFHKYVRLYNIDTSHFTGQAHLKGKSHNWTKKIPLEDILVADSTYTHSSHLKKRLVENDLLEEKCLECGLTDHWNGKPITLQLDHINGDALDNRIDNLRFLCPNCHSQTPTFAGKNLVGGTDKNTCKDCETTSLSRSSTRCAECHQKWQQKKSRAKPNTCKDCGDVISKQAERCLSCAASHRQKGEERPSQRKFDPTPEELKKLVWEKPATKVGKHFGVSSKAISKRCKKYGIKTPGRGYWAKKRAKG